MAKFTGFVDQYLLSTRVLCGKPSELPLWFFDQGPVIHAVRKHPVSPCLGPLCRGQSRDNTVYEYSDQGLTKWFPLYFI